MMDKRWRNLVFILILIIVLIIAYFFINQNPIVEDQVDSTSINAVLEENLIDYNDFYSIDVLDSKNIDDVIIELEGIDSFSNCSNKLAELNINYLELLKLNNQLNMLNIEIINTDLDICEQTSLLNQRVSLVDNIILKSNQVSELNSEYDLSCSGKNVEFSEFIDIDSWQEYKTQLVELNGELGVVCNE
jgi:hypothetical protein